MASQRRSNTQPELALRSELHSRGLRFRVDRAAIVGLRSRADIVFGPAKVAVYVDGCFWHSCPVHTTVPSTNTAWWVEKLAKNVSRDAETDRRLREAGWHVVRVWEHEDPRIAADWIEEIVRRRRGGSPTRERR